jgi:LmbE family N-acetylglucosaminyl deacetylase
MRARTYLELVCNLPLVDWRDLIGRAPFVVLSPHPDDETLGVGGLIAAACEAGHAVSVVIATDGSGSHPGSALYPSERLVALRHEEVRIATNRLGLKPSNLHHLDLRDTKVPTSGSVFQAAVERIAQIVTALGARTLLVTWRGDPHCDHEASDVIARAVRDMIPTLELLAYPIWGWHLAPDAQIDESPPTGARVDIRRWQERKRAAIAAYRSQMTRMIDDDPGGFCFTAETLAPFLRPHEYFIRIAR